LKEDKKELAEASLRPCSGKEVINQACKNELRKKRRSDRDPFKRETGKRAKAGTLEKKKISFRKPEIREQGGVREEKKFLKEKRSREEERSVSRKEEKRNVVGQTSRRVIQGKTGKTQGKHVRKGKDPRRDGPSLCQKPKNEKKLSRGERIQRPPE